MHILRGTALGNVEEVNNGRSGGGLYYYNAESRGHIIRWPLEGGVVLENPIDLLRAILRHHLRGLE